MYFTGSTLALHIMLSTLVLAFEARVDREMQGWTRAKNPSIIGRTQIAASNLEQFHPQSSLNAHVRMLWQSVRFTNLNHSTLMSSLPSTWHLMVTLSPSLISGTEEGLCRITCADSDNPETQNNILSSTDRGKFFGLFTRSLKIKYRKY